MEKTQIAIAVPNRSLIFTELENTLTVDILLTLLVAKQHREETEDKP